MKFLNNWQRELAGGLSASAVSAELTAAAGFALVEGETVTLTLQGEVGGIEQIEIVRVTAVDGTTLTLQRGQEGTASFFWPAGSIIEHRTTAAQLQQLQTWARAVPEDAPEEEPQRPHMRVPGGWVPYEEPDTGLPGWTASASEDAAVLAAEEGRDAIILPSAYRALRLDTEGDERGQRAVDMQRERNQPSEVASGFDALLGPGRSCSASGWGSVVVGSEDSHCTGSWSLIAGCYRGDIGEDAWQCAVIASHEGEVAEGARNALIVASDNSSASGRNAVVIGATNSAATGDRSAVISSAYSTAQYGSTVVGGSYATASDGSVVLGGYSNNASGYQSAAIAGNGSQATGSKAIAGGNYATASGDSALALGGSSCEAQGMGSVALGGASNTASEFAAAVLGGAGNQATTSMSAVIGGSGNTASGSDAVVIGGGGGQASGPSSAVIGGGGNQATEYGALAFGGSSNTASGPLSAVLAGSGNTASGELSAVLAGSGNNCSGDLSAAYAADSCVVDAALASASGSGALSHGRHGSHTRAGVQQWLGRGPGAAQSVDLVLAARTEDDTPAVLALARGAPSIPMPGTAAAVATIIARTSADAAAWQLKCLVHDGGLIGATVIDQIAASAGASGWAVDATMATGALEITVTGPDAATCTWVADVRLTESV